MINTIHSVGLVARTCWTQNCLWKTSCVCGNSFTSTEINPCLYFVDLLFIHNLKILMCTERHAVLLELFVNHIS